MTIFNRFTWPLSDRSTREAKRDDFVQGRAQCITEMVACQWKNRQDGTENDLFGIVSNGQVWQFYKLTLDGGVFETGLYTMDNLPPLLGALEHVCAEYARNVPRSDAPCW